MTYAMVAERPADVMACVMFAGPLRRAGVRVLTPVAYSKPRKQIANAKAEHAFRMIVLDGTKATIIDVRTGVRVETAHDDAIAAVLDLAAEWADFTNATAERLADQCYAAFFTAPANKPPTEDQ